MKAKDTVMEGKITSLTKEQQHIVDKLLNGQAEISFKAGWESGCYAEGYSNGIREVVEWIEDNCDIGRCDPVAVTAEWQAQKKRWGIEKK